MNAFIHGGALSDPIELNPYKVGKSFPEGAQDNFFAPNNIHFNYMMKNLLCVVAGGIGITSFDITSAAAALKLIRMPWYYDVILTSNLFGDIISDEGTGLTGTVGLYGSAELVPSGKGLYTPHQLHYPDESVIGQQKVSPIGMILMGHGIYFRSLSCTCLCGRFSASRTRILSAYAPRTPQKFGHN